MSSTRASRLSVAAAAVIAAVVALVFSLLVARATQPPGYFMKYVEAATAERIEPARLLDYSPLYLFLARLLIPLGGRQLLLLVQCFCGAATSALVVISVGALARARYALVAGILTATYRPFLVYAGVLEPECVILLCIAAAVALGLLARRALDRVVVGSRGPSVAFVSAAGSGICLGLAAVSRPQYVLLLAAWPVWIAAAASHRGIRLRAGALALLPGILIFTAVLIVRARQTGSVTVMDPGPVFYEGNGPTAGGSSGAAPELAKFVEAELHTGADSIHVAYRRIAAGILGRPVTSRESNVLWGRLGWETIVAYPRRALRLEGVKLVRALGPFEFADLICAYELDRRLSAVIPWGFGLLLIGVPWVLLYLRRGARELAGPLAVATLALAVQTIFSASARQRLPLALALLIMIPVAAGGLWDKAPNGRLRFFAAAAVGVAASALLAFLVGSSAVAGDLEMLHVLGPRAKSLNTSVASALDGRAFRPDVAEATLRLKKGVELYVAGRLPESTKELEVLAFGPFTRRTIAARSRYWLARCRLAAGRRNEARQLARQAFEIMPEDVRVAALDAVLSDSRSPEELSKEWRPPGVDALSARFALAREVSFAGRRDLAIQIASPVAAALPEIRGKSSP